ncbi:haloacid dehalogenase [Methylacidiphilum sp. Yel]|uniref:HAD family hydrolase n=1 Tax=Methylacidiphilum sp. Yel TaxID=1847730 RepID=UPI00106C0FF1|nr:HAD family hydrolase [Methylacidiphilum sp. Yel]TFE69893.1 haloacid dehalogenase [Methylacidiphilum sp. Yel]
MRTPFLFCTDFDGTLLSVGEERKIATEFYELLHKKKREDTFLWVINTGRSWESLFEELNRLQIPLLPDWVVLYEKEIFKVQGFQIFPHEEWNLKCRNSHKILFDTIGFFFEDLANYLILHTKAKIHSSSWSPIEVEASTNQEADQISLYIDQQLQNFPFLTYHRNFVYFRFAHKDFHKGSALKQIQRLLGISPKNSMACGDHFNDLPMLEIQLASHLACPANAVKEVKEKVIKQGGYVAKKEASLGITEALLKIEEKFDFNQDSIQRF